MKASALLAENTDKTKGVLHNMEKIVKFPACENQAGEQDCFYRKEVDFENYQRYAELKADLSDFLQTCGEVMQVVEVAPEPTKPHAVLSMDVKQAAIFRPSEAQMLSDILKKADMVVVSACGDHTRISVAVKNIWLEG